MPELPEVETARRSLDRALRGKKIVRVQAVKGDHIMFDKQSAAQVVRALSQAKVTGSGRKGKYFWLELDRRPWPVFHLGMTGNVEFLREDKSIKAWGGEKLWASPHKKTPHAKLPRFWRLLIETADGTQVAITDPRRFGRIRLAKDPLSEAPISKLGFDPLGDFPSGVKLHAVLQKRRMAIKAVLLDQKIFAGVGNWVADEVLFQAQISPHRLASSLTKPEVTRLRTRVLSVVKKAVALKADYQRYPDSWLFQHRWDKGQESYTSRGYEIVYDTVGAAPPPGFPRYKSKNIHSLGCGQER